MIAAPCGCAAHHHRQTVNPRKKRVTVAQVIADPRWTADLYLQGLPAPAVRERGSRRLTGSGLRHRTADHPASRTDRR